MLDIFNIFANTAVGNAQWVWRNIIFDVPWQQNYFWGLTIASCIVWSAECVFPWRKNQGAFRQDFWLDGFYMYFNFFIFSIAINGIYAVIGERFDAAGVDMQSLRWFDSSGWHPFLQLLTFFVLLDFLQWVTHRILHRVSFFWRFHQVHHSIKQMGFAGHLRYHWMENVLYKPFKTLGVMLIGGFEPEQAFMVHFFTIAIGHLNHANLKLDYGLLKYIFNNPVMHLYHHAYHLPIKHQYGMNFGLTLSTWDYLFKTAYVPDKNGDVELGYKGDSSMPKTFLRQLVHGFNQTD